MTGWREDTIEIYNNSYVSGVCKNDIALIAIDNPPMNQLSEGVITGLKECLDALAGEDALRTIIITGAGSKAFVAGADIKEFPYWTGEIVRENTRKGLDLFTRIENFPVPVIAAINGYALGGGLELALCCDIRIAVCNAKFGLPEVKLGIIPGYGGTQRLCRTIPVGHAKKMIYTGDPIAADEAKAIGLVQEVVEQEKLLSRVMDIAEKIASNGPVAVRGAKRAVNFERSVSIQTGLELELDVTCEVFESKDKIEGVQAFIEKRKPVFGNR